MNPIFVEGLTYSLNKDVVMAGNFVDKLPKVGYINFYYCGMKPQQHQAVNQSSKLENQRKKQQNS